MYVAPEFYSTDTKLASPTATEQIYVYCLGMTLYSAAEFNCDEVRVLVLALYCDNTILRQHYIATTLYFDNTKLSQHYIATTLHCDNSVLDDFLIENRQYLIIEYYMISIILEQCTKSVNKIRILHPIFPANSRP